jgi:hypothetical protein
MAGTREIFAAKDGPTSPRRLMKRLSEPKDEDSDKMLDWFLRLAERVVEAGRVRVAFQSGDSGAGMQDCPLLRPAMKLTL